MNNYTNDNTARRYKAHISVLGTSHIHLRNPYIIGWWSAAFPGFGHLLLSKYLRGYALFIWEVVVNIKAHVNLAMVYSFQGNIDLAKEVLDTRWLLMYIPVYLFAIWDSYRTTVDMNKIYLLAESEDHRFNTFSLGAVEINYLDKRNPVMSVIWSLFVPGLGQLYIHRILTCLFCHLLGSRLLLLLACTRGSFPFIFRQSPTGYLCFKSRMALIHPITLWFCNF